MDSNSITARVSKERVMECCAICLDELPPLFHRIQGKVVYAPCCGMQIHRQCCKDLEASSLDKTCCYCRTVLRNDLMQGQIWKAAKEGKAWAQACLGQEFCGTYHMAGANNETVLRIGMHYLTQAADAGWADAAFCLAYEWEHHLGFPLKALARYKQAAESGDPDFIVKYVLHRRTVEMHASVEDEELLQIASARGSISAGELLLRDHIRDPVRLHVTNTESSPQEKVFVPLHKLTTKGKRLLFDAASAGSPYAMMILGLSLVSYDDCWYPVALYWLRRSRDAYALIVDKDEEISGGMATCRSNIETFLSGLKLRCAKCRSDLDHSRRVNCCERCR